MNAVYVVSGLTGEAEAAAVTEELLELDGVEDVDVDLSTGAVRLTVTWPQVVEDVRGAVENAGLILVNPA